MAWELDHVFVLASPGGPEGDDLAGLGLAEGSGQAHLGQGTANRRFFFRNAMLELLWVHDEAEARSAPIARTRLWERSRWRETGASPFGICLRRAGDDDAPLPFETWDYRPPYVPPGMAVSIAVAPEHEPLLFAIPFGGRPDAYPPERRQPLDHPMGMRDLTGLTVTVAPSQEPSPALRALEALGIVALARGDGHHLVVRFDEADMGGSADVRPHLPLTLVW